ncbi:MAG TPA: hypothetical protein VHX17_00400 [Candidatus Cybelea sp.]|jgi:hypothetical protein|nr:hypothetical protein [Candidatus Cybelea sp.]
MRFTIIAAIALLSIGAAPRSPSLHAPPRCAFNMPLDAAQCARLHAASGGAGASRAPSANASTLLYTSDPFEAAVDIWTVKGKALKSSGRLELGAGAFPLGLTVDSAQNLYVAVSSLGSGTPSVAVIARGATKPSRVYTQGLTAPVDVAVDAHGTLYVANLANPLGGGCAEGSGPGGSVIEYAQGSSKPARTIDDFTGCPEGIAVDSSSNLYLTNIYYPATGFLLSDVTKYAYKSTHGTALGLQVPGGPDLGGIQIAGNGDLVVQNVQDDATLNQVLTFPQGSKTPSNTIQYPGVGWGTGFKFFALSGKRFYAPAYIMENYGDVATRPAQFAYPSGRELLVQKTISSTEPFVYGMAVSPGK